MKKNDIQNKILDPIDVENKIKRIGLQIVEDNINETNLLLVGISSNGKIIAEKILKHVSKYSSIKTEIVEAIITSKENIANISYDKKVDDFNRPVLIIGDVSQSGKTFQLVISNLMTKSPPKIKTAVIINRDHTLFPVKIDFCGLRLSTSVNDHVDLLIDDKGECSVYLN